MKKLKWILPIFVLMWVFSACSTQTPVVEPPQPEVPAATASLAPAATAPSELESQPTSEPTSQPETAPVEEVPEVSQPISRWNSVTEQGVWVLVGYGDALNPTVVKPGTYVTINFSSMDDQVNGSGGCNDFFTSYTADDEGFLKINVPIGSTRMACEMGMEQETLYLRVLETVTGYSLTESGELLLDYDSGTAYDEQMIFIPETHLVGTIWVLTAYGDPNNPSSSKPGVITTAVFSENGTLSGSTGCNDYVANYTLQGNQISVGLGSTTLAECALGMEQQRAFMQYLDLAQDYHLSIEALEITTSDGAVLQFSSQHLPLENVRWILTAVDGQTIPEGITANALFEPPDNPEAQEQESSLTGNAGCNNFFGSYNISGDSLTAGPFGVTRMMCQEPVMQIEQAFLAGLEGAQRYQVTLNQLTIHTSSGSLVFHADRFPLEGPRWILTGSGPVDNPQPPIEGGVFIASFARQFGMPSGTKSGSTGCRDYTATNYASFNQIKVNLPQTTKGTCTDAQLEAEQGYFLGLNAARTYQIQGKELYVYYDNNVFIYVGDYQVPGEGPLVLLSNTEWQLTSIDALKVLPGSQITALFEINPDERTGKLSGSAGCNPYNAEITDAFTLGPIVASADSCDSPEGVMDQEGAYLTILQTAKSVQVEGNTLRIITDQQTLYYTSKGPEPIQPTPTPEALTAVITAPGDEHIGQVITYDGSLSTPSGGITSYRWWFTDGTIIEGVTTERTYNKTGAYDAILTVTDSSGQKSEASVKTIIHSYLEGPVWVLEDSDITLRLNGNTLSGFAGCNDYNADYTAATLPGKNNQISVGSITQTNQSCEDTVMEREQTYLSNLQTASSYRIDQNSLVITTKDGRVLIFSVAK